MLEYTRRCARMFRAHARRSANSRDRRASWNTYADERRLQHVSVDRRKSPICARICASFAWRILRARTSAHKNARARDAMRICARVIAIASFFASAQKLAQANTRGHIRRSYRRVEIGLAETACIFANVAMSTIGREVQHSFNVTATV